MNKSAGILEIEAGITVVHNGFERILVPFQFTLAKVFLLQTGLIFIAQEKVMTSISEMIIL